MQHTIESFVRTLHDDGVAAGKSAAAALLREADAQAAKIIDNAKTEAEKILRDTRARLASEKVREEQELQLAARDALLELQHRLCRAVETMIDNEAARTFDDHTQLAHFIDKVATAFAAEQARKPNEAIVFRVAKDDAKDVVDQALAAVTQRQNSADVAVFRTETGLQDLGFEYRQGGSGVAVTPQAVVSLLSPLVSQEVARRLQGALEKIPE